MRGLIAELHEQAHRWCDARLRDDSFPGAVGIDVTTAWRDAISAAYGYVKAERARELRGDRSVSRFTEQGLHPFSTEWGRVMALEALLPGLSDVREKLQVDDNGEVTELFVSTRVLRLEAYEEAEAEFRAQVLAEASS